MSALIYQGFKLTFAILYPAYSSYKAVKGKNVKDYVKWMMYWIVFAIFTFAETFADMIVAWIPFYYEMKICFILWLIMPATKGSSVLYRKAVHPQLVKREKEIDNYISRASDHGYSALIALGSRGFSFATNMVLSTAIKGQTKLADHLSRSFSLSDLSDTSRELEQFNRRESTTSIDSDGVDSRRILQDSFRREMDNDDSPQTENDLSSEIDGGADDNVFEMSGSQSVPATPGPLTAEDSARASVLINRYLRSASLDTTRMTPGTWHPAPNLFAATKKQ